jgi:hypothetical protein
VAIAVAAIATGCSTTRQQPASTPSGGVVKAGAVMITMPRTICSDSDAVGTRIDGQVTRFDPLERGSSGIPDGSVAHIHVTRYETRGVLQILFVIDAVTIRGHRYEAQGSAISDIEFLSTRRSRTGSPTICYRSGAALPGTLTVDIQTR